VGDQAITAEGVMIRVLEMEAHRIVRVYVSLHTGELAKEAEDQQPELKV
jgi:hypothetical protein